MMERPVTPYIDASFLERRSGLVISTLMYVNPIQSYIQNPISRLVEESNNDIEASANPVDVYWANDRLDTKYLPTAGADRVSLSGSLPGGSTHASSRP
jgi:hypothetical protein